jgi:GNAT superfamily N-acetyltransferase
MQWFKDPNGLLATAEYDGHAIGCAKLSLLAEGQWWLEGFRVDPNHQGLKVGSRIHTHVTNWWLENCDGVVRLMTSGENLPVHHLCRKTGYVKTHEVCGYIAVPLDEPIDNLSPVLDTGKAAAFALASESLQLTGNRVDLGWRIGTLTEQIIRDASGEKADYNHTFYWWRDKQGLFSSWEDEEEGKRTLFIGVLACGLDDMPALWRDVRRYAALGKFDEVFQIIFDLPEITARLDDTGFKKHWEHNAFVFEKKHVSRIGGPTHESRA